MLTGSTHRKLEPSFDAAGCIAYWKCSECNWTKTPDDPDQLQATKNTIRLFAEHDCMQRDCDEVAKKASAHPPRLSWVFPLWGPA